MSLNCLVLSAPISLTNKVDAWSKTFLTDDEIWRKVNEHTKFINDSYVIDPSSLQFENVGGSLYAIVLAHKKGTK